MEKAGWKSPSNFSVIFGKNRRKPLILINFREVPKVPSSGKFFFLLYVIKLSKLQIFGTETYWLVTSGRKKEEKKSCYQYFLFEDAFLSHSSLADLASKIHNNFFAQFLRVRVYSVVGLGGGCDKIIILSLGRSFGRKEKEKKGKNK